MRDMGANNSALLRQIIRLYTDRGYYACIELYVCMLLSICLAFKEANCAENLTAFVKHNEGLQIAGKGCC